ncbi:hypothetical protein [Amycolatopsis sp. H20-H5]|uniref:hypothetical protein n=1 Tax=Amycolatopsis sp. H20-H5 TaxID=3046309 RepID=UPI002DBD532D|nr:hypothetical protein [Amycolatopsis sp. H20-H5]MEC3979889.1 hypothetical protein [Amycolatopsis sp. H20-H5]
MKKTESGADARGGATGPRPAAEARVPERFPTVAEVLVQVRADRDIVYTQAPITPKPTWPPAEHELTSRQPSSAA